MLEDEGVLNAQEDVREWSTEEMRELARLNDPNGDWDDAPRTDLLWNIQEWIAETRKTADELRRHSRARRGNPRRRSHRRRKKNPGPVFAFLLLASGLVVAFFLLKKATAPALPPPPTN